MTDAFIRPGEARCEAPRLYQGCGLEGIYLCNGWEVATRKGVEFLIVKDREDLHCAIARHLIITRKALAPKEIRFIRETMDLTQRELADLIGTTSQSVARWEKGLNEMPGAADRMLRIHYLVSLLSPEEFKTWVEGLAETLEGLSNRRDVPVIFDHDLGRHWFEREKEAA